MQLEADAVGPVEEADGDSAGSDSQAPQNEGQPFGDSDSGDQSQSVTSEGAGPQPERLDAKVDVGPDADRVISDVHDALRGWGIDSDMRAAASAIVGKDPDRSVWSARRGPCHGRRSDRPCHLVSAWRDVDGTVRINLVLQQGVRYELTLGDNTLSYRATIGRGESSEAHLVLRAHVDRLLEQVEAPRDGFGELVGDGLGVVQGDDLRTVLGIDLIEKVYAGDVVVELTVQGHERWRLLEGIVTASSDSDGRRMQRTGAVYESAHPVRDVRWLVPNRVGTLRTPTGDRLVVAGDVPASEDSSATSEKNAALAKDLREVLVRSVMSDPAVRAAMGAGMPVEYCRRSSDRRVLLGLGLGGVEVDGDAVRVRGSDDRWYGCDATPDPAHPKAAEFLTAIAELDRRAPCRSYLGE